MQVLKPLQAFLEHCRDLVERFERHEPVEQEKADRTVVGLGIIDAERSNPNGDPARNNSPRIDSGTGKCTITNVSMKHLVRSALLQLMDGISQFRLRQCKGATLKQSEKDVWKAAGVDIDNEAEAAAAVKKGGKELAEKIRQILLKMFWDTKMFGDVLNYAMGKGLPCAQIRGPVQFSDAESVDPVVEYRETITHSTPITDAESKDGAEKKGAGVMGVRSLIKYGLFVFKIFYTATTGLQAGVTQDDLDLLWHGTLNMYDLNRSSIRNGVRVRALILFEYDNKFGAGATAEELFDCVKIERVNGVSGTPAEGFDDYKITVDADKIPDGVSCVILTKNGYTVIKQ